MTSTTCVTSNANLALLSGLTVGQTYYARVYNLVNQERVYTQIHSIFCIGTLPAAPANDECSGAVSLAVNPDFQIVLYQLQEQLCLLLIQV
ncbi:hypothetical protein [Chryseobacterium indoltheticum]|uniref:hypothetical protein n=1 Tax=Chryseobacterium indoltheticum TaxID=254 RepID=UPI003F492B79